MGDGARTAVTIAVLGVILFVGAAWGWSSLTEPFPEAADPPTCVDRPIARGEKVYPDQVVVSVFNAGNREGLAGRTMQLLGEQGFGAGDSGNAPVGTRVAKVEIWTKDPRNPAVRLVASRFGPDTEVVRRSAAGAGVFVVVGDAFQKLVAGRKAVRALDDVEVCGPPSS